MADGITLQHVAVALQTISSLSIAAGFLFGAYQFRAYRRAAHVANFTKLVELQMHLREMRVTDPKLAQVYRHDMIGMDSERQVREYFFNLMQISVFEIVWFAYEHGQVPEDYFRSWETRMRDIAAEDSFRATMSSPSMKIMHDDFWKYLVQLVESTRKQPTTTRAESSASTLVHS
jgi:hypothetical protein